MQPAAPKQQGEPFDQARDQQIRSICDLLLRYWQADPDETFDGIVDMLFFVMDDENHDTAHEDTEVYAQLKALYEECGNLEDTMGDVRIGAFVAGNERNDR